MTKPRSTILIVDDDLLVQKILEESLRVENYATLLASDAAGMMNVLNTCQPDIILLDCMLPDACGYETIPDIRTKTVCPVIMLSSRTELSHKINALELGADDYLTKPFQVRELFARIKVQLRHKQSTLAPITPPQSQAASEIRFGRWRLDRSQFQIFDENNQSAGLSLNEFQLLDALISTPNRVLTREQILDTVRKGNFNITDRAIDTQIARIRKKLGDDRCANRMIQSVRGLGYKYTTSTQDKPARAS